MHGDKAGAVLVVNGPFAESKALIAGYTLIEVASHDEALAWAKRFPAPFVGGIDLPAEDAERTIRAQLADIKRKG